MGFVIYLYIEAQHFWHLRKPVIISWIHDLTPWKTLFSPWGEPSRGSLVRTCLDDVMMKLWDCEIKMVSLHIKCSNQTAWTVNGLTPNEFSLCILSQSKMWITVKWYDLKLGGWLKEVNAMTSRQTFDPLSLTIRTELWCQDSHLTNTNKMLTDGVADSSMSAKNSGEPPSPASPTPHVSVVHTSGSPLEAMRWWSDRPSPW